MRYQLWERIVCEATKQSVKTGLWAENGAKPVGRILWTDCTSKQQGRAVQSLLCSETSWELLDRWARFEAYKESVLMAQWLLQLYLASHQKLNSQRF